MNSVEIQAHDGKTFKAHIAMPDKTPAGAVILIQEIFGINQDMREKCEAMADLGFIGIAPDLFWRIEPGIELYDSNPEQLQRAFHLFSEFDVALGIKDLQSTLSFIRKHPDCNGHVGAAGYCLGGKLAYLLAASSDIDASVSYYGVGIEAMLGKAQDIKKPILLHIAGNDQYVPKDAQDKIIETMKDHDTAEVFHYPGLDHAFARENGMHYNEQAAILANERTATFLQTYLGSGKVARYAR